MTDSEPHPGTTQTAAPRRGPTPEWEVFVREASDEPLKHVGSVSAPTATVAHEQAAALFEWAATDIWLCRADEVTRYSERTLDPSAAESESEADDA